jgi:hypothetical protein
VGHLAADQVGLVLRGAGDQHVRIARTGFGQHVRLDAAAHHTAQFDAFFEFAQAHRVGVDDGDVVALGDERAGHTLADPACAEDDDLQRSTPDTVYTPQGHRIGGGIQREGPTSPLRPLRGGRSSQPASVRQPA